MEIEWKAGGVVEARIPLGKIFELCGYEKRENLYIRTRISTGSGEEFTGKVKISTGRGNWALTLL